MDHQLIPPPDLAPPSVKHLTPTEKILLWAQMIEQGDQLVMAGLRHKLGPDADLRAAFIEWRDRNSAERDRELALAAEKRRLRATKSSPNQ